MKIDPRIDFHLKILLLRKEDKGGGRVEREIDRDTLYVKQVIWDKRDENGDK